MGFLSELKEKLRDKTRDELSANICAAGINAVLTKRGQREENVGESRYGKSLGLIEIQGSPIRWVNVLRWVRRNQHGGGTTVYTFAYLIPDATIRREMYLQSVRKKDMPIFGQVVDLYWKSNFGDFWTTTIADETSYNQSMIRLRETTNRLNEDVALNQCLLRLEEDIEIRSYPEYGYWTISPKLSETRKRDKGGVFSYRWPSRELIDCYETIGHDLLELSRK